MKPTIAYVIAAYLGGRHYPVPGYDQDRFVLLRDHYASLRFLPHRVSEVYVMVSGTGADDVRRMTPERLGSARVSVHERPNGGYSYGAWVDARQHLGPDVTHVIVMEDDYIFRLRNFDLLLLGLMAETRADYMCGFYNTDARHAAHSNGCLTIAALRGCTLATAGPDANVQVDFSSEILQAGFTIADWLQRYSTPHWHQGRLIFLGDRTTRTPFVRPLHVSEDELHHARSGSRAESPL